MGQVAKLSPNWHAGDQARQQGPEEQMSTIGIRVAIIEAAATTAETIVNTLHAQAKRLEYLESNTVSQEALKKERRWLVGISVTVAGSIVLPLVAVLMSIG